MDPFVRAAVIAQRGLGAVLGSLLALLAGAFLVFAGDPLRLSLWGAGVFLGLLGLVTLRLVQRYRQLLPASMARLEIEIGVQLTVLIYGAIELLPGGIGSAGHALAYGLMLWSGALLCRPAAVTTWLAATVLELGLRHRLGLLPAESLLHWKAVLGEPGLIEWGTQALLLGGFSLLNRLVLRTEVWRVRRLSHDRVTQELDRVRQAARSYRLRGASRAPAVQELRPAAPAEDDRLAHSSVDHLQVSLRFMLLLLREALRLRTALVLWFDAERRVLHLREASSHHQLSPGPFSAAEGVLAASLSRRAEVLLQNAGTAHRLPYYATPLRLGAVYTSPLIEQGELVGLLVVDTDVGVTLDDAATALLQNASALILRAVANERLFLELQQSKTEQGKLYHAADLLAGARTEAEVIRAGVDSARQFTRFDFAAVTIFHRSKNQHEICAVSGDNADELVGKVFRHNAGLVSMVVANRHPLPYRGVYQPARQLVFDRRLEPPPMPSLIVLPLCVHETALGTLLLGSSAPGAFGEEVLPTLEVLARHIAVSLANARMMKRLEDLATTDGMTGLYNKRTLTEIARQKIRSAERFKKPLSLIIGDIDHFKRVNDNCGHDVGDQVIKGFGDVLRRTKRETDAVGRFGGEEFVLVCEETDAEGALLLAERIRQELEATTFHAASGPLRVTCSLGVATFPAAGTDWEGLFKSADEALYVAKRQGRNAVMAWQISMRGAAA